MIPKLPSVTNVLRGAVTGGAPLVASALEGMLESTEVVEDVLNGGILPAVVATSPEIVTQTIISSVTGKPKTIKRYVEEPAWRIPTLGLVEGPGTLGRGAG